MCKSVGNKHGRSQDFSKGGSHSVKQRVLAFSQPEYCKFAMSLVVISSHKEKKGW